MSNCEKTFKRLNLQDLLISPDFASFTRWFCELTEDNCLTEDEIVKINELKAADAFIDDGDSMNERLNEIVGNTLTDVGDLEELQDEYVDLKDTKEALENMLSAANGTELKMDEELNRLNSEIQDSQLSIESLTQNCQDNAQMLEHMSMRNMENRNNFLTSFSNELSYPMRWCRLNYENYFVDSDNTALSIKLLYEKTLKFKENSVDEDDQHVKRLYDLYTLETTFTRTALAHYEKESDLLRVNTLTNMLSKPFQPMTYASMSEQIERLTRQNEEIAESLENVDTMVKEKIAQLGHQEAKFCEVENNREKLGAAEKRLDLLKKVAASMSDYLLLSELLWLSLHMELKTAEDILENVSTAHYERESEQCARNSEILTEMSSNATADHMDDYLSQRVAEIIADDIVADGTGSGEVANPIVRYGELIDHFAKQLRDVVSDSYQIGIVDLIKEFNGLSAHWNAFIGNGPSNKPNILNLSVLAESEVYKHKFDLMFDLSRMMRHNFMERYHQPFTNDELWKRRQLLWIWFLTDEKLFLEMFQKTVGDSKTTNLGNVSIVGGIKRQK